MVTVYVFACLYTAGGALLDFGESMKQLSQSKDALDISVKHNFIDPVQIVVDQNIKDVQVEASFFMPPLLPSAVLSVLNMFNQQVYSFYNLY